MPLHILGGVVALAAGFAALALRKGSPLHGRVGTAFFLGMLVLAGTGSIIALSLPERGTATIGVLSCYLVATSWRTARRRDGEAGGFELAGFLAALGCASAFLAIGLIGLGEPDGRLDRLPAPFHFPFAALAALAAALDLSFLRRRRLGSAQRLARHLWRMCAALLIAAMSFFLGQQDNMPEFVQGSPVLFAPPLVVLAAMLFWIFRMRFAKRPLAPHRDPAVDAVPGLLAVDRA